MDRRTFVAALPALAAVPLAAAQSQARRQLSRMRGDLGDPLESIIGQMASTGITPRRTRRGKYRIFTYPFGDRSQLIFWFEPAGEQQGLVLYMIDVEE